jgi:hypothetical protein
MVAPANFEVSSSDVSGVRCSKVAVRATPVCVSTKPLSPEGMPDYSELTA